MTRDPYEDEHARVRPLLGNLDEELRAYERAANTLADACKRCPDKEWVNRVMAVRVIQHKHIGRTLETATST